MKYLWFNTITEEDRAAIDRLKADCLKRDGRLPLLNLPEQPEACDGCLAAVTDQSEIAGILTCLYSEKTVEVCILVHPNFRGRGTGTELLHRLILSTKKIPVFPVAADDTNAIAFLTYIGRKEICREMRMTLSKGDYSDADPKISTGKKKWLHVTCKNHPPTQNTDRTVQVSEYRESATAADPESFASDGQYQYTLYCGVVSIGRCLVTEGCISGVWIHSAFRGRGYGSFLLRTVIRHQFYAGRKNLFLHVTNLNEAACSLYRKYGFETTEEVVTFL